MDMLDIYHGLLEQFGPQGWWSVGRNFEPKEWEICIGAVLTQNTSWKNVERALDNLESEGLATPEDMLKTDIRKLRSLVRPSGYYRQKAGRLKTLARFVLDFGSFGDFAKNVSRDGLLGVKGIGPETCDSILLYACGRPHFVVDAYTRRFLERMGKEAPKGYEEIRETFESALPRDPEIYKEFHALIVEWGKSVKGEKSTHEV